MRGFVSALRVVAAVALLATAGGCGSLGDSVSNVNLLPKMSNLARPDWLSYSGAKDEFTLRPVTAADLVSAEGQCAMTEAEAAQAASPDGAVQPVVTGGIALQMTECDVVRRAGAPEQLQVGADQGGERSVVIIYSRGPRPGIYRFTAGRLTSIERGPEAPAAKATPKAKSGKKKKSAPS